MTSNAFVRGWAPSLMLTLWLAAGCSGSTAGPTTGAGGAGPAGGATGSGSGGSGAGGASVVGAGGNGVDDGGHADGSLADGGGDAGPGSLDARAAGGASGQGGGTGTGGVNGAGGGASCAGRAVSFGANVPGNNDPAMARVVVDFGASADLPTGNAQRTIEWWAFVRASSWVGDANTMLFYGTNNRVADGFGLDFGATPGTIDPFTNAIFDNDNQPSGVSPTVDQWVHFAMTWDGTAVRAFVNGVQRASKTATGAQTTLMTGRTPLIIGGYPPAFFNGQIDELRIWNVAHTAAEISSTMRRALLGTEAGLVGYWKFDETGGTAAADATMTTGHVAHAGTLMANTPANLPAFVASGAPIACP